ncbi:MAG TPA: small multi-drug export protein [Candidatus Krumholzibacteria bacterium]|nr:small multi-drug export protein [Candidatus Krumholzibacteria bacterium]
MGSLIALLSGSPHALTTFLLAMAPISELRGAIPYAMTVGGMTWQQAYVIAVIGNFVPVIPILLLIGPLSRWLCRYPVFERFFNWLFARTRRKGRLIERFEALGVCLFVAVPLPMTGAWTGAAAAFVFGVRLRYSVPAIAAGILIAGAIVTLVVTGAIGFVGVHAPPAP